MVSAKAFALPALLFACLHSTCNAQNQSVSDKNLSWYSQRNIEKHSGMDMNSDVKIVTRGKNSVDVVEHGQAVSFTIQTVSGTWMDENQDGTLTYSILFNGRDPGKLIIQRFAGDAKIIIDFSEANSNGIHQEYFISNVSAN